MLRRACAKICSGGNVLMRICVKVTDRMGHRGFVSLVIGLFVMKIMWRGV